MDNTQENNQQVDITVNNNALATQQTTTTATVNETTAPIIPQPSVNEFQAAQEKAKQKLAEDQSKNNNNVLKNFIDSFQAEYGKDETLKNNVDAEIKSIQSMVNMKDKDEVLLSYLNQSIEKMEQIKKRQVEIQKEREEIEKITGYTEIIKKIDLLKKDKNYNEVWKILEEKSPKLAFDTFKSLTNNFINTGINMKVTESSNSNAVIVKNKTAMSAGVCLKKGDGYF